MAVSPSFLIGPAPAPSDTLTAGEGTESPRPRATRWVEPLGNHEFCTMCKRHGRGRVPTVLWGSMCQGRQRETGWLLCLALILMGDGCDSDDGVDTMGTRTGRRGRTPTR
jgi:hypothetical protein